MLVLVVVLFVVALLLAGKNAQQPSSSSSSAPTSSSREPVSSSAPSSSLPQSTAPDLPAAAGQYDLEGLPPLYNRKNEIPDAVTRELLNGGLIDVGGGQQMQEQAAGAFLAMYDAARQEGVDLAPVSGYRSNETQSNNYENSIRNYEAQGSSHDEAVYLTQRYYAVPGTSEHEAGLAMDIGWIEDSFGDSAEFGWLQEHCAEYGFIFRYRSGDDIENITGIAYEPWHYRFVGANHAKKMNELGLKTLEEYIALYSPEGVDTTPVSEGLTDG